MSEQTRIGTRGFSFKTGDHVEHFSVTQTTRCILQGCPKVRADGTVLVDVRQDCSCLQQTRPRNLAQFTGRGRTRHKLGDVGATTAEQIAWSARRKSTTSLSAKRSLAARSRGCGLHVSWWRLRVRNRACLICRRGFSISMLRARELRLVSGTQSTQKRLNKRWRKHRLLKVYV